MNERNEYKVITQHSAGYVYADSYTLFPKTAAQEQMAKFYREGNVCLVLRDVISVTLTTNVDN